MTDLDAAATAEQDEPITYRTEIFQALGTASMCWTETPRGVFESQRASELGDRLVALHEAEIREATARERQQWHKRINALYDVLHGTANGIDGNSEAASVARGTLRTVAVQLADLLDGH